MSPDMNYRDSPGNLPLSLSAMATNVDLILADEPTGNLNEDMTEELIAIFKELANLPLLVGDLG